MKNTIVNENGISLYSVYKMLLPAFEIKMKNQDILQANDYGHINVFVYTMNACRVLVFGTLL